MEESRRLRLLILLSMPIAAADDADNKQTSNRLNKIFNFSFYEPTTAWCKNTLGERDKLQFDHLLLLSLFAVPQTKKKLDGEDDDE